MDSALASRNEAEAPTFCFGSQQDVLDDVARFVEEANRRFVAQNLNAIDRYVKREVAAHLEFRSCRDGKNYQLVFCAIPGVAPSFGDVIEKPASDDFSLRSGDSIADPKRDQSKVFLGVSNFVDSPKGRVPSFVTLEAFKESADFRWQILASSGDIVPPVRFRWGEGKFDRLETRHFADDRRDVAGLIENGAEIVCCVEQDAGQILRNLSCHLDFVNFLSRIRVFIDDVGPRVAVDKISDHGFEITDVVMCASEREARTMEGVTHER